MISVGIIITLRVLVIITIDYYHPLSVTIRRIHRPALLEAYDSLVKDPELGEEEKYDSWNVVAHELVSLQLVGVD